MAMMTLWCTGQAGKATGAKVALGLSVKEVALVQACDGKYLGLDKAYEGGRSRGPGQKRGAVEGVSTGATSLWRKEKCTSNSCIFCVLFLSLESGGTGGISPKPS